MAYPLGGGGDGGAGQLRAEEEARQKRIRQGTEDINRVFDEGFTPDFYDAQTKAYEGFALPELNRQFSRAGREGVYDLAGKGLLRSSIRDSMSASLGVEKQRKQREVADTALSRANDLRANVEDQRSRLISQVIASGDPSNATQSAISAAGQFKTPSPMGSIGQFFTDWSNVWLNREADRSQRSGYNDGLNAWNNPASSYNVP